MRSIGKELADTIDAERERGGLYVDTEDLVRRVPSLTLGNLEAMATAGVFEACFGLDRRESLWTVGATLQFMGRTGQPWCRPESPFQAHAGWHCSALP